MGLPVTMTRLPAALAWDWCLDVGQPGRVLVVSARLPALLPWRRCLRTTGLPAHRLDIPAAVLRLKSRFAASASVRRGAYHVALLAQPLDFAFDAGAVAAYHYKLYRARPGTGGRATVVAVRRLASLWGRPSAPGAG